MKNNEISLHGEVLWTPTKLPKGLKKLKPSNNNYHIVGASESLGNHHVVDIFDGVDFYEDDKGALFLHTKVETNIRCLHANRHDTIKIAPGSYEFGTQQEYDPFEARLRKVRD